MTQAAGKLNHRIRLESLQTSQDANGETVETWTHEGDVWANVSPVSGKEFIASAAMQSQIVARVTVRYRADIQATWRILFRNRYYNVEAVLADVVSGLEYLTLPCSLGVSVYPDTVSPNLDDFGPSNPIYIAHRGNANLYPDNTMEAFAASISSGLLAVEPDVQALSDGDMGVMHDLTVDRTTTSTGNVNSFNATGWAGLSVDSNNWFGGNFGNNLKAPFFSQVVSTFKGQCILAPESKAGSVADDIVALSISEGVSKKQLLVQSFDHIEAGNVVTFGYQSMLLATGSGDTWKIAEAINRRIPWLGVDKSATDSVVSQFVSAKPTVVYTVNRRWERDRLLGLGVAGFFSDDANYLKGTSSPSASDNFAAQTWLDGMQHYTDLITVIRRGKFYTPDAWGWDLNGATADFVLQGYMSPIKSDPNCDNFVMDLKVTFTSAFSSDNTRWASVFIANNDRSFGDSATPLSADLIGYHFLMRKTGEIQIYRRTASAVTQLATAFTTGIVPDGTEVGYRITVTPTSLRLDRLNNLGVSVGFVTSSDTTPGCRGGYFHFGRNGLACRFRDVSVT